MTDVYYNSTCLICSIGATFCAALKLVFTEQVLQVGVSVSGSSSSSLASSAVAAAGGSDYMAVDPFSLDLVDDSAVVMTNNRVCRLFFI